MSKAMRPREKNLFLGLLILLGGPYLAKSAPAQEPKPTLDWKAHWIWTGQDPRPKNFYAYVRKVVDIPEDVGQVTAYVSADSRYKLFVNGEFLGRGPARCDPRWQTYDVYDLSHKLRSGRNVVAALVHHYGVNTGAYLEGRGGFLFQADGRTRSGKPIQIISDQSWKIAQATAWVQRTPRVSEPLGFIEVYDANYEPIGWQSIEFNDSAWKNAAEITEGGDIGELRYEGVQNNFIRLGQGLLPWRHHALLQRGATIPPWTHLVERDIPMLLEEERFPVAVLDYGNVERNGVSRGVMLDIDPLDIATEMSMEVPTPLRVGKVVDPTNSLHRDGKYTVIQNNSEPENGTGVRDIYLVVDFGTVVTGRIRITLDGVKGGVVDLGYAERLTDGRVVPNMGSRYADRYIMRDGLQTWEPFNWKAFRYVLLTFRDCDRPVKVDSVSINFTSYPVRNRGAFESSDDLLNKIWEACRYTMQLNMQDAFMDTPWREQRQWVEDGRMELQENYYAFGDTKLAARYLREIAQSQQPDGMVASYYPAPPLIVADDCLEWVMTVWDYYMYTGDRALLQELYPVITKLIAGFEPYVNSDGLLGELPYSILFDLMAAADYRGVTSGLNAEFYAGLNAAANMGRVLGDEERVRHYRALAQRVRDSVNRTLWATEKGAYADSRWLDGRLSNLITQMSNGMVLFAGIPPAERVQPMVSYIMNPRNPVPQASPFGVGYLLPALFASGHGEEGMKLIRDKYGFMIRQGFNTIWEYWRYDGDPRSGKWATFPRAVAHAGGTIAGYQLQRSVLGVAATKPGFQEFAVDPEVFDLQWAKGVVPTVKGDIPVRWQRKGKALTLQVKVPGDSVADVGIPTLGLADPQVKVDGHFQSGKRSKDRLRFRATPGEHMFELVDRATAR